MKNLFIINGLLIGLGICLFTSCEQEVKNTPAGPPFELLTSDSTGLSFHNTLYPSLEFNVFNYMYFYNGGGAAAGDFNNDGLVDLYFTANQLPNKMFLNRGDLHFEDITGQAGVEGSGDWKTGVSVVDINGDGLLDIYVNQVGEYRNVEGKNELFVCTGITAEGIPKYEEKAEEYGLDLVGFGTQAAFLDYDLDGDLDMYQMNHSIHQNGTFGQRHTFDHEPHPLSGDKFMRNDGTKFTDVTTETGIHSSVIGYGLGLAVSDIDGNGYPDIYVANDFHENDYLYINNGDGTFTESLTDQISHTSRFSMGVDIADINNDGYSEIFSLDMHPEDPIILKSSLGEDDYGIFHFKLGYGYNYQYARNTLQLNNGDATFSDIGVYAGVHASDWSWATLFTDFDNDGLSDIFVANGIPKRMNDIDYVNYVSDSEIQGRINTDNMEPDDLGLIEELPEIKLYNKFYRNNGDLTFADLSQQVQGKLESYSNGAVTADFDNDGDIDIVVNNINEAPFLYRNTSSDNNGNNHFLQITLIGQPPNTRAIGTKVVVKGESGMHIYENFPVRGYQSVIDTRIHVGLGSDPSKINSIEIIWPDGKVQPLSNWTVDSLMEVEYAPAGETISNLPKLDTIRQFNNITSSTGIDFRHDENDVNEFNREQLLPHMTSREGPALAVGDVNGDGKDDVYLGGAKWQTSALYVQTQDGMFTLSEQEAFHRDSICEDVDAFFADLDNDGDLDLFAVSGGNEFFGEAPALLSRVYLNDGKGNFERSGEAIDSIYNAGSCAVPLDINGDGALDVFLGSRAVTWKYGEVPTSYLLINDGQGHLHQATEDWSDELASIGMVKDAAAADIDGNGHTDLIIALEWGPVTIFYNDGRNLKEFTAPSGDGWWNFVLAFDADADGDIDILAGGPGENTKLKPDPEHPVRMFVNDFDGNEQVEQLITYYLHGQEVPLPTYREVTRQMPNIKKKYLMASDFAKASLEDLVGGEALTNAIKYKAETFSHILLINGGDGRSFEVEPMPQRLQFTTLNSGIASDVDGNGFEDLILGGNFSPTNIELGRYDAGFGGFLLNKGDIANSRVNLLGVRGEKRFMQPIQINGQPCVIIARNNDTPVILKIGGLTGI